MSGTPLNAKDLNNPLNHGPLGASQSSGALQSIHVPEACVEYITAGDNTIPELDNVNVIDIDLASLL